MESASINPKKIFASFCGNSERVLHRIASPSPRWPVGLTDRELLRLTRYFSQMPTGALVPDMRPQMMEDLVTLPL